MAKPPPPHQYIKMPVTTGPIISAAGSKTPSTGGIDAEASRDKMPATSNFSIKIMLSTETP